VKKPQEPPQSITVLLIEDNPGDARLVQEMLSGDSAREGHAFAVSHVERLSQALDLLTRPETRFDLALVDLSLPDSQGLDTVRRVLGVASRLPIIVLSGHGDQDVAMAAVKSGAQDYFVKGHVDEHALPRAIRYAIERKRVEEMLRESEERFRDLFEGLPVGLYRTIPEGQIVDANPALAQVLDYPSRESLLAVNVANLYVDPEERRQQLTWLESQEVVRGSEIRLRRYDGAVIWARDTARAVRDAEGRTLYYEGSLEDVTERRRMEDALRQERDLVAQLIDTSPVCITIANREGQITFANPRAEDMLGLTRDEIVQHTYDDPDWRITAYDGGPFPDERLPFRQVMDTGRPVYDVRHAIEWPDGRRVFLSINGAPLLDESGEVDQVVFAIEDVTAHVRAEEELYQYNERLRALHAIDGAILAAWSSEEVAQTALRHMRRLIECRWAGVVTFDLEAQAATLLAVEADGEAGLEVGSEFSLEGTVDTEALKRGQIHVVADISIPSTGEVGRGHPSPTVTKTLDDAGVRSYVAAPLIAHAELIGVLAVGSERPSAFAPEHLDVIREIADQIAVALRQVGLRSALKSEQQQLQALVGNLPEGILLLDGERRILLSNPVAETYLPILTDAAGGDALIHLGGLPARRLLQRPHESAWREVRIKGPPERIFEVYPQPLAGKAGTGRWLVLIRDVTEEREAQRRAQQQERLAALGELAGGIAHDFNNLLTTIILNAQLLLQERHLSDSLTSGLQTIATEGKKAASLVEQILDFSRRSPIKTRPVNLKPLIKEAIRMLERTVPESISLHLETGPGEHVVNADPTRIQQVLMNLVINARDAMPQGGQLRIDLTTVKVRPGQEPPAAEMKPGEWVCLAVTDAGRGIPAEALPHIFEPFFTTKPTGHGTGLGLAQVYGIVKQHEGHITVDTEVGRGTTFRVWLPAHGEKAVEVTGARTSTTPQGQGEIILLVEDNERILRLERRGLEALGYRVLTAADGRKAVEACRSAERVDLVVTDVVMPQMGGPELIRELRKERPGLKAVFTTGYALEQDLQELEQDEALDIIQKPFDITTLATAIRRALDS